LAMAPHNRIPRHLYVGPISTLFYSSDSLKVVYGILKGKKKPLLPE
jgi:hypothetical protein